ncbi:hypothetical protein CBL_11289 [Carabus blaptoides fortunei]
MKLVVLLFAVFTVVNCQWVNITTHVINTTYIQGPSGGPPQYIVPARNLTQSVNPLGGTSNQTRFFGPRPVLLFSQSYYKPGHFLKVREIVVPYRPLWGGIITTITTRDLQGRGSARILQGGIGFRFVTIQLQSQRGAPLNFQVSIYGL